MRGKLGCESRCWILLVPASIERNVECLATRRRRRREIERPKERSLVANAIIWRRADIEWDARGVENRKQSAHRIGRHANRSQSARICIEKRLKIIRAP